MHFHHSTSLSANARWSLLNVIGVIDMDEDDQVAGGAEAKRVTVTGTGAKGTRITLSFRNDDATRSVLRQVLEAMGTEERGPIVTDGDRMYGWCGRCGTSSRYVTGPFARLAVVDWLAEHEHRVHDDRPPTPTGPVCDHCGKPVEGQQCPCGRMEWAHTGDVRHTGDLFFVCETGQKVASVGGTRFVPGYGPVPAN